MVWGILSSNLISIIFSIRFVHFFTMPFIDIKDLDSWFMAKSAILTQKWTSLTTSMVQHYRQYYQGSLELINLT